MRAEAFRRDVILPLLASGRLPHDALPAADAAGVRAWLSAWSGRDVPADWRGLLSTFLVDPASGRLVREVLGREAWTLTGTLNRLTQAASTDRPRPSGDGRGAAAAAPRDVPALRACPVCACTEMTAFDRVPLRDGGTTDMLRCASCESILHVDSYSLLAGKSQEELENNDFYRVSDTESCETHQHEIALRVGMVDWLAARDGRDRGRLTFCDFGCGRGYVALSASETYGRVVATDWNLGPLRGVLASYPQPPNLIVDPAFSEGGIDVLFMSHVLEHIPEPVASCWDLIDHLNDGAVIYVQIPMVHVPAYVFDGHYVFYTEAGLRAWARAMDAVPLEFAFDPVSSFLTMVARHEKVRRDVRH
jgi:hypothetical protein